MRLMLLRKMSTSTTAAVKKVPIPKNGVDYRGKIVLAPMVRSGELPSRLVALKYGADLVWGPETIDKALLGTTRSLNPRTQTVDFTRVTSNGLKNPVLLPEQRESLVYRLHPEREKGKLIFQIGSANPDTAVQAAKLIASDVAGIDVNAGCPKPFSTSGGMGAALLKTPEKLCAILRALVSEVGNPFEIGISVKIRLLETPEKTQALVRCLCATGITGLTIHCRTTPMRPREAAIREQLRMIVDECHDAGVACLMNGDVAGRDEALQLMEEFGADGAMIATAAERNPSVFRSSAQGGLADWQEIVREYLCASMEVENRWGNAKYLLGQMIPGRNGAHAKMMVSKSYSDIAERMDYASDPEEQHRSLVTLALNADRNLQIGQFEKPRMSKAEKKRKLQAAVAAAQDAGNAAEQAPTSQAVSDPVNKKRSAEMAELDERSMPADVARSIAPGTVPDHASFLAV